MSYNPVSAVFFRTNSSQFIVSANESQTAEIDQSIVGGSNFDGTNISRTDGNDIITQCDLLISNSGVNVLFQCYWTGGAAQDRARQATADQSTTLYSRDEFWGLGSSIRPLCKGLSATNATIQAGNATMIEIGRAHV